MPNSHTVQGLSVYRAMQILNGNIKAFNLYAESPNLHNSYFVVCIYVFCPHWNSKNRAQN